MKFRFSSAERGGDGALRPFIHGLQLPGLLVPIVGLVDSGAAGNRFDLRLARQAGIDPSRGRLERLQIGGAHRLAYRITIDLRLGRHSWRTPVSFVEDWPVSYQVLGLDGFFDQFDVRFKGAHEQFFVRANS